MKRSLAYTFDIEIDYYVLVGVYGVRRLVKSIGGVDVVLARPLVDSTSHVSDRGLVLKRGRNHLSGKRALAFARSRHSDNDYERARRQQQLIAATASKVLARGEDGLAGLVRLARDQLETDLPWTAAPALMALADRARLSRFKSIVLGPSRFAGQGSDTYTTVLRIDVVREAFRRIFDR
jgi:anionic cell wall polymer biosynthesis LytR-Cps2A-Psr (LCP) family protein